MEFTMEQGDMVAPDSGIFFHRSGNTTTFSSELDSLGGFMAAFCLFAAFDALLVGCILLDARMRADGAYIYTAAVATAMMAAMTLDMTQLIGFGTPGDSWTGIDSLCEIGVTIQPCNAPPYNHPKPVGNTKLSELKLARYMYHALENISGLFLFFNMLEYHQRYKTGDPSTGPLSVTRTTLQLLGSIIAITVVAVIPVWVTGEGVIHYRYEDKLVCDIIKSENYILITVVWRSVILVALLPPVIMLLHSKWEYSYYKDEPFLTSLDGVIGVICVSLTWIAMTAPLVVTEAMAHTRSHLDENVDYLYISRVLFLSSFGVIPIMWILVDPVLAVNANRCCKTNENIEEVEVVVEHARF